MQNETGFCNVCIFYLSAMRAPLCFLINYLCFLIYVILSAFSHINPGVFARQITGFHPLRNA